MTLIEWIDADTARDVPRLGGKGAGLAFLTASGVRIPPAFVVTADAYRLAVPAEARDAAARRVAELPADAPPDELEAVTAEVRERLLAATDGHALTNRLRCALRELEERAGTSDVHVAVRSSSIAEDSADKSFAGEHDTYLWVSGPEQVDLRLRQCWASLFTARAVSYRGGEADPAELAMAVVVQQMAPARSAGVMMTLNPVNGDRSKVMIESVWGLGEPLVSGEVTPDRFLVDKVTGEVVTREIASKPTHAVRDAAAGSGIATVAVEDDRQDAPSLSGEEIAELLRIGRALERAAGGSPQDAEFAVLDGEAPENVRLLQCRPETVWSNRRQASTATGRSALESVMAALTGGAS